MHRLLLWSLGSLSHRPSTYGWLVILFGPARFQLDVADLGTGHFVMGRKELFLFVERGVDVVTARGCLVELCLGGASELLFSAKTVVLR